MVSATFKKPLLLAAFCYLEFVGKLFKVRMCRISSLALALVFKLNTNV